MPLKTREDQGYVSSGEKIIAPWRKVSTCLFVLSEKTLCTCSALPL